MGQVRAVRNKFQPLRTADWSKLTNQLMEPISSPSISRNPTTSSHVIIYVLIYPKCFYHQYYGFQREQAKAIRNIHYKMLILNLNIKHEPHESNRIC